LLATGFDRRKKKSCSKTISDLPVTGTAALLELLNPFVPDDFINDCCSAVLLVPRVSWVTPANVSEGGLLLPSLHYCQQQWDWCLPLIVSDMGHWGSPAKQQCREQWGVSVLAKLRSDMKPGPPYVAWHQAACPQGSKDSSEVLTSALTAGRGLPRLHRHAARAEMIR
jgi:hypothetical protein